MSSLFPTEGWRSSRAGGNGLPTDPMSPERSDFFARTGAGSSAGRPAAPGSYGQSRRSQTPTYGYPTRTAEMRQNFPDVILYPIQPWNTPNGPDPALDVDETHPDDRVIYFPPLPGNSLFPVEGWRHRDQGGNGIHDIETYVSAAPSGSTETPVFPPPVTRRNPLLEADRAQRRARRARRADQEEGTDRANRDPLTGDGARRAARRERRSARAPPVDMNQIMYQVRQIDHAMGNPDL